MYFAFSVRGYITISGRFLFCKKKEFFVVYFFFFSFFTNVDIGFNVKYLNFSMVQAEAKDIFQLKHVSIALL